MTQSTPVVNDSVEQLMQKDSEKTASTLNSEDESNDLEGGNLQWWILVLNVSVITLKLN